jgi:hypothetical protein
MKQSVKKAAKVEIINKSYKDEFVFIDKTLSILEVGFQTQKNLVLYGPGE